MLFGEGEGQEAENQSRQQRLKLDTSLARPLHDSWATTTNRLPFCLPAEESNVPVSKTSH